MAQRRQTDDDIYRAHSRYLGPRGFTLPVSIPYLAMVPGAVAFLAALAVLNAAGVGGIWRWALGAGAAVLAGKLAVRFSGHERPVTSLPAIFAHETGAPRPSQPQPQQATLRPAAIPVREVRPPRRQARRGPS